MKITQANQKEPPVSTLGLLILSLFFPGGPPKPPLTLPSATSKGNKRRVGRTILLMIDKQVSLKRLLDHLVRDKIITLEVKICLYYAPVRGHIQLQKATLEVQKEAPENRL